jgi:hypothetical protein
VSEQLTLYGEPGWRYDEREAPGRPSKALEHGRTMAEIGGGSTGPTSIDRRLYGPEGAEECRSSIST